MARRSHRRAAAALLVAALAGLSGCGQSKFEYAAHKDSQTYFKVPGTWHKIDQDTLQASLRSSLGSSPEAAALLSKIQWIVAYDASDKPSPDNWLEPSDQPFVYARVRRLLPIERESMSLEALRDSVGRVNELHQQELQEQSQNSARQLANGSFHLRDETEVKQGDGVHGLRTTYDVRQSGENMTVDQLALVDPEVSRTWVLTVSCSSSCFESHKAEIDKIMDSFTVRNDGRR